MRALALNCAAIVVLLGSAPARGEEWVTTYGSCVSVLVYDGDHRYWGQILVWNYNKKYVALKIPRKLMEEQRGVSSAFAMLAPRLAGCRVSLVGYGVPTGSRRNQYEMISVRLVVQGSSERWKEFR